MINITMSHKSMYLFEQITRAYGYLIRESHDDNLLLQCPNGHTFNCTVDAFKQGRRCQICKPSPWRHTTKDISLILAIEGYSLVGDVYKNQTTPLQVRCSKNHEYETTWQRFRKGFRCPVCAGNSKKTIELVRDYISMTGYELLSEEYINNKSKLKMKCDKGHLTEISWHKFRRGIRCGVCYRLKLNDRKQ